MKIAIVYDRVNKWGGAERVLLAFQKIFPEAILYTSVYDENNASWAKSFKIKPSFLQNIPLARRRHELFPFLMPIVFESHDFSNFDLVISITSEAAKGVIVKNKSIHLCYCLTPTRYLWSSYDEYFKNRFFKFVASPAVKYLRRWEKASSKRPDEFIAISKEVKNRIKKYYNRDSEVIYPPLLNELKTNNVETKGKYFLVVSRLVSYKRVDLAVKACTELNLPLVVVGTGWQEKKLKSIAGKTIKFVNNLTDKELSEYYKNCIALIFPGLEEFGLVMAEAQAFGKPVIAFKSGGALDIIKDGKTGVLFKEQTVESLKESLKSFDSRRYNSQLCVENSKRFLFKEFETKLREFIKRKTNLDL